MTEGKKAVYNKDYPEAINFFTTIIATYDDLYEAYFYRGVAKYSLGDFIGAEQDFNRAIEIKPYYPKAYHYRALTKDRQKQFHLALQDYNKAIDQEPGSPHTYINRGIAKVLLKYYYGAIEDCEYAVKLDPKLENGYLCLGAAKSGLEEHEDAIGYYNKALGINRFNEDTYTKRGSAKMELNRYEEALQDLNEALHIDSTSSYAYFSRALLYSEWEKYDLALKDYNKVIALEPENALAYFNRAILMGKTERFEEAEADYNIVEQLNPKNVLTFFNRAIIRYKLDNITGALQDYNKAIEIFPEFGEAYFNRAIIKRMQGDHTGAERDYQMAQLINEKNKQNAFSGYDIDDFIELDADFESGRYNRDKIQNKFVEVELAEKFVISFAYGMNDGEPKDTYFYNPLNTYNKAHENSPRFIMVNRETKLTPDDIYALLNILNDEIRLQPENPHHYFNRAVLKGRIEDYNGAIEDYNKAIELKPDFVFAYFGRANIRVDLIILLNSFESPEDLSVSEGSAEKLTDNHTKVLEDYKKTLELNDQFSYAWHNLGNFNVSLNRFEEAIENYSRAIETNGPLLAETYFNRGLIRLYLKNNKAACADLGKAGEKGIVEAYNVIHRYCNK